MNDQSRKNQELMEEISSLKKRIQELEQSASEQKQAEGSLRAGEERHRIILQTAMNGFWMVDPQGRLLEVNETYCRMSGYSEAELLAMRIPDLEASETIDETFLHIQKVMAQGEDRFETRHRRKDGTIFDVEVCVQYRPTDGGWFVGFLRDITKRKRAQFRMARLNDCFLQFGASPVDNINRLVAVCGELMDATCALYNRLGKNLLCSVGQWQTPSGFKPEDKPNGHICYDVIQQGGELPLLVRNLQESPYARTDPNVLSYNLQTYLGMAVKWKQTTVGSLCVVYNTDITPSKGDLQFMVLIAAGIGVEEGRWRAEEALRQSEENFHRSLDESPLGVRIVTIDDETLYANRAILDIYGYDSVDELRLTPVKKRYTAESYAEFKIRFEKRLRGEFVPPEYEISIVKKDGEVRRLLAIRRAVLWDGKERFLVLYRDITYRRRMEEALRKREEELAAESRKLADTNTTLGVLLQRREEDLKEVEQKIVANVQKSVLPYLGELRKRHSTPAHVNYLDIIESNLRQIINPFLQNLTARFADFTSREIQIANLIKDGKSSKEISDILNISVRSVEFHRDNIRKKLGLAHKANKLRTFLLTLTEK